MNIHYSIVVVLVFVLGSEKPFLNTSKAALALPLHTKKVENTVVFIAGFDEGDNTYYTNAKRYFEDSGKLVITGLFSIDEINQWLNKNTKVATHYDEIHIVSHSNPWLGMSLKTTKNGNRITFKTLHEARKNNKIASVQRGISTATKIIFHACGLGANKYLLQELKHAFASDKAPKVVATSFFNVFGGKFAGHYLAKPYYVFYPTAESPGPMQLSQEIEAKYPKKTNIDWFTALKTRKESSLGTAYSYKFNIPVNWEFTFDSLAEVPKFKDKEALIDWIAASPEMAAVLFALQIPIEKYRWRSETRGNKLMIKGKVTVLCVLAPILQDKDTNEYQKVVVDDPFLYQIL